MWFLSWNSWHLLRYRLKNGSGIPTRSCSTGEMCVRKNTHTYLPAAICTEHPSIGTYVLRHAMKVEVYYVCMYLPNIVE